MGATVLRRGFVTAAAVVATSLALLSGQTRTARGDWPAYGSDNASTRYSPLDQINKDSVKDLRVAWRQSATPTELRQPGRDPSIPLNYPHTPLMVDGLLYMNSGFGSVVALDPATGKVAWFDAPTDPEERSIPNRGLGYWSDGREPRVLTIVGRYLVALHAKTGKRIAGFGNNGRVDLGNGIRRSTGGFRWGSPPMIIRDVVVVGGLAGAAYDVVNDEQLAVKEMPPGDVRGYDVRTGRLLWTFHTVPEPGEAGAETWLQESGSYSGNAGIWGSVSGDDDLGHVYLPIETASGDYFGGTRPGNNLFAESLVCLDAKTGKRLWHFQAVHHGIWDYDFTAAPVLMDLRVDGKRIKAIAQVSKQAFVYVLDRTNGRPVWPIVERPVPRGDVPGEWYSPTQPFPTKPPAFDQQGMTQEDLIDFTPELRQQAIKVLNQFRYGPIFTPPSVGKGDDGGTKGTVIMPGTAGGANWTGASADPETGILYVPTVKLPVIVELVKSRNPKSNIPWVRRTASLAGNLELADGLPILKPPYGSLVAIDLNKGEILWRATNGDGPRNHAALSGLNLPPLGQPGRVAALVTKSLVFLGEGGRRAVPRVPTWAGGKMLRAFDKQTGQVVWEMELPGGTTGAPMTYFAGGKQYIVVAVAWEGVPAELVALAMP
jgi:quinoprotein glucose dehydrogenase